MDTPTTDTTVPFISERGLAALENELAGLRARKTGEVAEELRDARSFGSPDGNDELWAVREDEVILDARIARLEEIIARSRVVETGAPGPEVATIDSVVELEDVATGATVGYRIVGVHDRSPAPDVTPVSAASPVGRAILGESAGARVSVELPDGRTRRLRLVSVKAVASAQDLAVAG
jgi:transcription elongation factor GreA